MARRVRTVTSEAPSEKTRNRRSPDQIVADLQAEIERVKQRSAPKEAKANPQGRALLLAARTLSKASESCTGDVRRALEAAQAILGEQMVAVGIRVPQRRKRQEAA